MARMDTGSPSPAARVKPNIKHLCERLEERLGSAPVALLIIAALALGVSVIVGVVSTLFLLGLWPFFKLSQWLFG